MSEYHGTRLRQIRETCRDCAKRYLGCHDHCEEYQEARREWDAYRANHKNQKYLNRQYDSFVVENILKQKRS